MFCFSSRKSSYFLCQIKSFLTCNVQLWVRQYPDSSVTISEQMPVGGGRRSYRVSRDRATPCNESVAHLARDSPRRRPPGPRGQPRGTWAAGPAGCRSPARPRTLGTLECARKWPAGLCPANTDHTWAATNKVILVGQDKANKFEGKILKSALEMFYWKYWTDFGNKIGRQTLSGHEMGKK